MTSYHYLWRGGRVDYRTGLENRSPARDRGFESLPLRQSENFVAGSSSARDRQPILGAKLSFLSLLCEAKQPEAGFSFS